MIPKPEDGETRFAEYLDFNSIPYTRDYIVENNSGRNVDFCINKAGSITLADVKIVSSVPRPQSGEINSYRQIGNDIMKLRDKFKKVKPKCPVVLVTINHSSMFFTGYTVLRALFGKINVDFSIPDMRQLTQLHFSPKSGAKFNLNQNTLISGVLVFDHRSSNVLFVNPFAKYQIDFDLFPNTKVLFPNREQTGDSIIEYSDFQFDGYYH